MISIIFIIFIILAVSDLFVHFNIHLITSVVFEGKALLSLLAHSNLYIWTCPLWLEKYVCSPFSYWAPGTSSQMFLRMCDIPQFTDNTPWVHLRYHKWSFVVDTYNAASLKFSFGASLCLGSHSNIHFVYLGKSPSNIHFVYLEGSQAEFLLKYYVSSFSNRCVSADAMNVSKFWQQKIIILSVPSFNFFHQFIMYLSYIQIKILWW